MCALARLYAVVVEGGLHNEACRRYVGPAHRHTEGIVARTPSSGAYEDVSLAAVEHLSVYFGDLGRYGAVVERAECVGTHIYDACDVVGGAMSERRVAAEYKLAVG